MIDTISERDAGMMLNSLLELGDEKIKDSKLKNDFNYLVKTDKSFKKRDIQYDYK